MYYSKIGANQSGFTNQIFSLISSIMIAYKEKKKVIIVDNFLNDINKKTYTPISDIFNITDINIFLKHNYDIIIIDKNNIQFEIISFEYGSNDSHYIDLTDIIKNEYLKNNKLVFLKQYSFNNIKGDPCPGIVKNIIFKYKINDYYIEEIYNEYLDHDIIIDFNGPYIHTFNWVNSFNNNMFDKILTNISYNNDFILKAKLRLKEININKKINIIHLRLEEDGIKHWSKINNISCDKFKNILEEKYINIIKNYLSKTDENIILTSSISVSSNGVINFLIQNNYNYRFIDKFFEYREKNAIIDLLVAQNCNNIFIGNYNIKNNIGSSFSYYITKYIKNIVTNIYIDLDKIYDKEVVFLP